MSPDRAKVLAVLAECRDEEPDNYWSFAPLMRRTGMERAPLRRAVRALHRAGLAEFGRGLVNLDGEFAGSGYRCSDDGYKMHSKGLAS